VLELLLTFPCTPGAPYPARRSPAFELRAGAQSLRSRDVEEGHLLAAKFHTELK